MASELLTNNEAKTQQAFDGFILKNHLTIRPSWVVEHRKMSIRDILEPYSHSHIY